MPCELVEEQVQILTQKQEDLDRKMKVQLHCFLLLEKEEWMRVLI